LGISLSLNIGIGWEATFLTLLADDKEGKFLSKVIFSLSIEKTPIEPLALLSLSIRSGDDLERPTRSRGILLFSVVK